MYTANKVYKGVNSFLYKDYWLVDDFTPHHDNISIATWIYGALRDSRSVNGVFYRGMQNIDIEAAFGIGSMN